MFKIAYISPDEPPEPDIPNLDCSGSLSWSNIHPGATVNGTFQIQNIGDNGSLLNWTINTSSVTWGTWSYSPASGKNLTPEDGQVIVHVVVTAPNEKDSAFNGNIRVENQEDPNDTDVIPVYLKTPSNEFVVQMKIFQSLLKQKSSVYQKLYDFLR